MTDPFTVPHATPDPARVAAAIDGLLAGRPDWHGQTDHEAETLQWEIALPVPADPAHRAAAALLLILVPVGGEQAFLSLSLRMTRPALAARWRRLLDQRDLRAGNAELELGGDMARGGADARDPAGALLDAVRRAEAALRPHVLAGGFDPTHGRWFAEEVADGTWVFGHEVAVVRLPATVAEACVALQEYADGVLARLVG
jgi:hypothetical protein